MVSPFSETVSIFLVTMSHSVVIELVMISSHTSATEGETALLACIGYGLPDVEVTWLHNGGIIVNSSLSYVSEEDVVQERRLLRQSFLQICDVEVTNAGVYTCIVSNAEISVNSSTELMLLPGMSV